MARLKMINVLLERKWSGHPAGEVVTVEDYTANSMIKKGYGHAVTTVEKKKIETAEKPKAETATAPPSPENAMANPEIKEKLKPPEKKGGAD
jgi:uncharacterized protein YgiM (DUF1202 family)